MRGRTPRHWLHRIAFGLLLAGCAGPTPLPIQPLPEPDEAIALGPGGSKPLAFTHVVYRIPAGTLLGVAHWVGSDRVIDEIRAPGKSERDTSFNVTLTDLLRENGYDVVDDADAIFDVGRTTQVRYQLAGVIHAVEVDVAFGQARAFGDTPDAEGVAVVEFELQVHDRIRNQTIFKRTYSGWGMDTGKKPVPVVPAVVDAMRWALADEEFVALVAGEAPLELAEPTSLERCPLAPAGLPDEIDRALESVVRIRVGGATGSGVIISREGHVITAAHVVGEAAEAVVRLHSGFELPASVTSRDPGRDVALLELPGQGYPCASLAAAGGEPSVGSDVFAVNLAYTYPEQDNPPAVTRGVVSGYPTHDGRRYIQTDAALNPGSSGGPMFDRDGHVVGIVTRKIAALGVEGVAFGVPIEAAGDALAIGWD